MLATPDPMRSVRFISAKRRDASSDGAAMDTVTRSIPAIVPTPNTARYPTAQRGSGISATCGNVATAAEPASP